MTENFIQIDGLPEDVDLSKLVAELKACDQIRDADYSVPRAVDPGSIMVWVEIVTGVISSVSGAITVIMAIRDVLRKHGLQKAEIKSGNGAVLSVENASAEEIRKLLFPTSAPIDPAIST